jgi:uncharacterized protein DUF433
MSQCYPSSRMPVLDYPHIRKTADEPARLERLPRIRVAQIVADHIGNGWSAEEILRQYPHLQPAEVHAALAYYFDHREEIDRELTDDLSEAEEMQKEQADSTLMARLRALKRRSAT